jgi:hypothetical protein
MRLLLQPVGKRFWSIDMGRIWTSMIAAASMRLWALIGAGMAMTGFAAWLVNIVAHDPWPESLAAQRLTIMGWGLYVTLALVAIAMVSLASVRVKGAALGGSLELDTEEDPMAPQPAPGGPG